MSERLTFKQEFKSKLAINGISMRKFAQDLNLVPQNLSQRINRGKITYDEAVNFAARLGYVIEWKKAKNGD